MTRSGTKVVDVHQHIGGFPALLGRLAPALPAPTEAEEVAARLAIMDANGIDQSIVMPGHEYLKPDGLADTAALNDAVAAYRDRDPARFPAALAITEPLYGTRGLDELTRCSRDLHLVGVTVHTHFQGVSTDSQLVADIVSRAAALGMVPLIHAHTGSPDQAVWKIARLAGQCPDTTVIAVDAFSGMERAKEVWLAAELAPNLVFDTALADTFAWVLAFVADFGAHRVIFGTDLYSTPFAYRRSRVLDQLMEANLTDADRSAILSGNVQRIFSLRA